MSEVLFISDLHFGHANIVKFGRQLDPLAPLRSGEDWIENMHNIINKWNAKVTKRDTVYVLGDIAFNVVGFEALKELIGNKIMIRGNHDEKFTTEQWLTVFKSVESLVKYKEYWLSHPPIHPAELRGRQNIHGHVHHASIRNTYTNVYDDRYINVSCEAINETPISLDEIRYGTYWKNKRC